jgi:AraC-like DNA-binding protein
MVNGCFVLHVTVLAYLPTRLLQHLRFVLGGDNGPIVAKSWVEVGKLIQENPISVAIIDPTTDGVGRALELQQIMVAYPSLPVIAYVPLTPLAFATITELAQTGLRHALLYSSDDGTERFLSLIEQVQTSPLTIRVISALRPKVTKLPLRLAKTVENLFAEPHRYPNAQDIATISTIPLVRVHRSFRDAGLATPKKLFVAAKMLRAFSYLGDPGHTVYATAKKLGYRHQRIFSDHSNELFGLNPSRLHSFLSEDQVFQLVTHWVSANV